jgi:hypothetical protein
MHYVPVVAEVQMGENIEAVEGRARRQLHDPVVGEVEGLEAGQLGSIL